jgi:hypothetical protein
VRTNLNIVVQNHAKAIISKFNHFSFSSFDLYLCQIIYFNGGKNKSIFRSIKLIVHEKKLIRSSCSKRERDALMGARGIKAIRAEYNRGKSHEHHRSCPLKMKISHWLSVGRLFECNYAQVRDSDHCGTWIYYYLCLLLLLTEQARGLGNDTPIDSLKPPSG